MITIATNNHITLDGRATDFGVSQHADGTKVYNVKTGEYLSMPQARYALSHDAPASGVAGRAQFEADLRKAIS